MSRPKFDPVISRPYYSDVADILDTAVNNNGMTCVYKTDTEAIHKMHRMNKWRAYNRRFGVLKYDKFIIRRDANRVMLVPREAATCEAFTLDGKPLIITPHYDRTEENAIMSQGLTAGKTMAEVIMEVNAWRREHGIDPMPIKDEDWEAPRPNGMKLDIEVDND